MEPHIWPSKSRRASLNIRTATWDVALMTCQRRWTIGRRGKRGSGISMLVAWHDDDDGHFRCLNRFKFLFQPTSNRCKSIILRIASISRAVETITHVFVLLLLIYIYIYWPIHFITFFSRDRTEEHLYIDILLVLYVLWKGTIYQPLRSGRIWHKVNF